MAEPAQNNHYVKQVFWFAMIGDSHLLDEDDDVILFPTEEAALDAAEREWGDCNFYTVPGKVRSIT